jgi:pSer/pThr/pTyr-binding forkhead associated (FHA) protein
MSSSLDHKCQRCGSQFHGQVCPFCTISGLDVNALLASEGVSLQQAKQAPVATAAPPSSGKAGQVMIVDLSSMKEYPVTPPVCRFGRDISNDIVLTGDKSLSRFHFQISQNDSDFTVEDSGSRNGTFLNGSPCTAPRKVLNGDIISAGMSRYRFVSGEDSHGKNGDSQTAHESKDSNPVEAKSAQAQAQAPSAAPSQAAAPSTQPVKEETKAATQPVAKPSIPVKDEPAPAPASTPAQAQTKPPVKEEPKPQPQAKPEPKPETPKQQPAAAAPARASEPPSKPTPAKPASSQAQDDVDPLKRLFEEGQALLNKPEKPTTGDGEESSVDKLLPGKENELGDTASRFLKMANRNPLDNLFPETPEQPASDNNAQQWPQWCTTFTFPELADMNNKVTQLEEQISVKQAEMANLKKEIGEIETGKNRLLASRDADMVNACADIFIKLGWTVKHNGEKENELVLSADDKAAAIARVVSTDAQPKAAEIANLVSSLSTYWCDHGVEPKGILVIAFVLDGPPQSRPELTTDFAQYAAKKNLCLMNSLQLIRIFREIAVKKSDKEKIKSELLGASGQLPGFEVS